VSQEGTKDVWTAGKVAGAESVPDFFCGKVFEGSEVANKLGENSGAGGSRKFSGNIDLPNWDSSQNLGGSGSGEGVGTVGTLDRARPFNRNGGGEVGKAKVMEADGSYDDIHDRIDRTDLVKMDFVDQFSVKTGLGFGDTVKDLEGSLFNGGSEVGVLEEGTDLSPRATMLVFMGVIVGVRVVMGIVFVRSFNKEAGAGQATPERSLRFQDHFFREVKTFDSVLKEREGHAEVEEGGSKHVSADSGGTIEMEMGSGHDRG